MTDITEASLKKVGSTYIADVNIWPLVEKANYLAILLMEQEGRQVEDTSVSVRLIDHKLRITIKQPEAA